MLRNKLWNTVVFKESIDRFNIMSPTFSNPVLRLDNRRIRTSKKHVHTIADPFLFVNENSIFLFVEEKRSFEHGKIKAFETNDLRNWHDHGIVLDPGTHCSYPFVFKTADKKIKMLPETVTLGEASLYDATSFPREWKKSNSLVQHHVCDSSILRHDDCYYLFACSEDGENLNLFFCESLSGAWTPHPQNPIVTGKKIARNGGGPVQWNDKHFRFAQDCEDIYGSQLHLFQIDTLNKTEYAESLLVENYLPTNQRWHQLGGHHFSFAEFQGDVVYAADGRGFDHWFNKPLGLFFRYFKTA